jgi:hypothetical protein
MVMKMSDSKVQYGQAVRDALRQVMQEGRTVRLFEEEEEQVATQEEPAKKPESTDDAVVPIEAQGESGEQIDLFVPTPETLGEIDDYKFVDILNRLRASPSFTEGEVRDQFDKLWESLQAPERYFLYIAMLGFTQVVLKGAKATEVSHPHNFNLNIKGEESGAEKIQAGVLPADLAADLPAGHIAPIVVGEGLRNKKWLQANAARLRNIG